MQEEGLMDRVLAIWREVLGAAHGELAADSNFFLHGGDSLQLTRVLVRVRERLGVDLQLRDVASFSTPAKMARCCDATLPHAPVRLPAPRNSSATNPGRFACTGGQTALWLAEQCAGGCLYNTAVVVHFSGDLRVPALTRALELLQERHELLRASLHFDTRKRRLFTVLGAEAVPAPEPVAMEMPAARTYLQALAAQPFDLAVAPLWRFQLVEADAPHWALLLCQHHCITDGWSGAVLLRHLAEAYNALLLDAEWRPVARDREFRQYCQRIRTPLPAVALAWWRTHLDGADRLPHWPNTGTRRWPFVMACEARVIDRELLARLHQLRAPLGVDLSACLFAGLRLALRALTGLDELCIGMPVNLRNASAQEEGIGYFVNLLVLRERLAAGLDSVAILQQVQRTLTEALRHRTVLLPELARQLQPQLLPSGNPWCDLLFADQNLPWDPVAFTGLSTSVEPLTLAGQYPLKVEFLPQGEECVCRIEYAHTLLAPDVVRQLHDTICAQLASLCESARNS